MFICFEKMLFLLKYFMNCKSNLTIAFYEEKYTQKIS